MYPEAQQDDVRLETDHLGKHFGLFDGAQLLSVVSVFQHGDDFQFRKFATSTAEQGKGHGSRLLQHVIGYCGRLGARRLWCNARVSARPFYKRFGFSSAGEAYEKAGISYIKMERFF
ncbi:GNAT family N-acetyltransferase [Pedobacter yulinensis]|uniref:GNAT family N-acetyltransferase n=2 Tax=Pedobacter yulinensis TaxID=2126353 RepID=A0A2T3HGW7_9SPHI|nr:GNAT family N-acetyltransferase [Pedobacter yulinensis]